MTAAWGQLLPHSLVVNNGWDPEPIPTVDPPSHFRIAFAGSIYIDRNPETLFAGVAAAIRRRNLKPTELTLEFMGGVNHFAGRTLTSIAATFGILDHIVVHPSAPRRQVLQFLATASVLVSLPQGNDLAVPSKIFEYMLFPAHILALAEPSSATGQLLANTDVSVVSPTDIAAIEAAIGRWYDDFTRGIRPPALSGRAQFSRRGEAIRMFEAIESL